MANLTEVVQYDAGVYQIETGDPVVGGANGIANAPLKNLANRTAYLKQHLDLLESGATIPSTVAPIASPALTGTPTAPTQALGNNSTRLATTAFVQATLGGYLTKSVAGGSNVTLTAVEAGNGIIALTGVITANINVIVPVAPTRSWIFLNRTSGAFTVTIKTSAGTGVVVAQNRQRLLCTDGVNVFAPDTDFLADLLAMDGSLSGLDADLLDGQHGSYYAPVASPALTGTPTAPTAPAGTSTTQISTTAFVMNAVANLIASSPAALDTLKELAAALGNDANFATTMTNALAAKAPLASPALTGTPTAPTPAVGTNTTQVATAAFVIAQIASSIGSSLANATNLNTVVNSGFYRLGSGHTNVPAANNCNFGQLLVIHGGGDTIAQIIFDYASLSYFIRSGNPTDVGGSGSWTAWTPIVVAGKSNTWSATQAPSAGTLTDAATVAWNGATAHVATLTLGGNRTMGAPTGLVAGAYYGLRVVQDATGGRSLAWNAVFKFPGGSAPTLSAGANAVDILTFYCPNGTNLELVGAAQDIR